MLLARVIILLSLIMLPFAGMANQPERDMDMTMASEHTPCPDTHHTMPEETASSLNAFQGAGHDMEHAGHDMEHNGCSGCCMTYCPTTVLSLQDTIETAPVRVSASVRYQAKDINLPANSINVDTPPPNA